MANMARREERDKYPPLPHLQLSTLYLGTYLDIHAFDTSYVKREIELLSDLTAHFPTSWLACHLLSQVASQPALVHGHLRSLPPQRIVLLQETKELHTLQGLLSDGDITFNP